jgi:site-specific DNA-methyltransferase (adenine-specific)
LEHGTGAINIDGGRIGTPLPPTTYAQPVMNGGKFGDSDLSRVVTTKSAGRWPANVILDEEAGRLLDEQSGVSTSGAAGRKGASGFADGYDGDYSVPYGDTGGASRFFYCAKAGKKERNAGLEGFEDKAQRNAYGDGLNGPRPHTHPDYQFQAFNVKNHHPTVKPVALMRYLVRLVTPKGGTVLDPFTGSGTTGIAATLEGFQFIGFEQSEEYARIADARIAFWSRDHQMGLDLAA